MIFSNLETDVFLELKSMSADCFYSISTKGRCWKFMFDGNIGIALIKHTDFTENDMWSVVAIKKENNRYFPIDDIWSNVSFSKIFKYANLIKELYL